MLVVKVTNENGCAKVEVIQPGGDGSPDTTCSCTDLQTDQQVLLNVDSEGTVTPEAVTAVEDANS